MWSTAAKNAMLDALTTFYVSAHDDYPGDDGSNELSGGSPAYARKALTFAAASARQRVSGSTPTLDIPAGSLAWLGLWSAETSGTYLGCHPNAGARKRFVVDPTADTFTVPSHGYVNGDTVVLYGVHAAPGGLTKGTVYYVVSSATDTFKLSETLGGSAVDLTDIGGIEVWVSRIVVLTYAAQGTYAVTGAVVDING